MPASRAGSSRAGSVGDRSTSPIQSRRRAPTVNDFPVPGDYQQYTVKTRDQGLVSPAASAFSFQDNDAPQFHAIDRPASPVPSLSYSVSTPRNDLEKDLMVQNLYRGGVGDGLPMSTPTRTPQERDLARKKSMQYYQEVFALKEPNLTSRERVYRDSIITVEVKTNVIIKDEYLFLDELAFHLSQRYQRPTSSIFITLDHSACLLFAGTFDSAYILTIHALPSQLQASTNKRNTALIQSHMASSLGVLPDRGVIRFQVLPDEFLATKGTTYAGQIERLEKKSSSPISSPDEVTLPQEQLDQRQQEQHQRQDQHQVQQDQRPPQPFTLSDPPPKNPARSPPMPAQPLDSPRIIPHLTPDKSTIAATPKKLKRRQSFLNHLPKPLSTTTSAHTSSASNYSTPATSTTSTTSYTSTSNVKTTNNNSISNPFPIQTPNPNPILTTTPRKFASAPPSHSASPTQTQPQQQISYSVPPSPSVSMAPSTASSRFPYYNRNRSVDRFGNKDDDDFYSAYEYNHHISNNNNKDFYSQSDDTTTGRNFSISSDARVGGKVLDNDRFVDASKPTATGSPSRFPLPPSIPWDSNGAGGKGGKKLGKRKSFMSRFGRGGK